MSKKSAAQLDTEIAELLALRGKDFDIGRHGERQSEDPIFRISLGLKNNRDLLAWYETHRPASGEKIRELREVVRDTEIALRGLLAAPRAKRGALRDGWSITPLYRGSTTVRGYSTSFRGSSGPIFDRRRDAAAWVNESGSGFERQLTTPHRTHVKLAPGSDRFRAYCDCGWFSPVKYRDRAGAETEAQLHERKV